MRASTFDRYVQGSSPIHQLDPRVKVIITLLFIISNVLLPDGAWLAFGLAWLFLVGGNRLAGFRYLFLFKRSFIVLPFLLAAVTVIFTLPGESLFTLSLGSWDVTITDKGLIRFGSILIRSWLSVQMAILLTATTQFPDLMHALHHLRMPGILVSIISFMYRYLFVLAEEVGRLLRAREARSARLTADGRAGGTLLWRAKVTGYMAGQLFIRSFERSERVYQAMLARGYQGQLLTMNPHQMVRFDWSTLFISGLILLVIQLSGWWPFL